MIMSSLKRRFSNSIGLARTYYGLAHEIRSLIRWYVNYCLISQGGRASIERNRCQDAEGDSIPWMTYPAIEYLKQFDFSGKVVLEFGSGASTDFWARRALQVTAIESNAEWYAKTRKGAANNVRVVFAQDPESYATAALNERGGFDIVVIDGVYRFDCAGHAVDLVADDGIIILDNSDWFPATTSFILNKGFLQIDFMGPGPLNSYAWATSLFVRPKCFLQNARSSPAPRVIGGLLQTADDDQPWARTSVEKF
jgi:hypothetical protein